MPDQYSHLLSLPNVTGFYKGTKKIRGVDTGLPCLVLIVRQKVPLETLAEGERVPPALEDGTPTDVVQLADSIAYTLPPTAKHRPLVGGISIGWRWLPMAGTLGAIFLQDGELVGLTNKHVGAPSDFDPWKAQVGDDIKQPGVLDAPVVGTDIITETVGTLKEWVPIDLQGENEFDQAVFRLTVDSLPFLLGLGAYTGWYEGTPELGMKVRKPGRTTGVTSSTLLATGVTKQIGGYGSMQPVLFKDLDLFGPELMKPGDSGSVIVTEDRRLFSHGFAGGADHSLGIRLVKVRDRLRLQIPPLLGIPIEHVLGPLPVKSAFGYDARVQKWLAWFAQQPQASDLLLLERGKGYYVIMEQAALLEYAGNRWPLEKGNNLIGCL